MKHLVHAAAVAAVLFGASGAWAQTAEMGAPVALRDIYGMPIGTVANPIVVSGGNSSSSATTTTPTALTPTTIAAANTYQQAAATGAAKTNGGFLQTPAANTGSVCVDTSASASAGRTTPTGGQICAAPGSTVTFPATSGAVFVYDATAGDTFSGSVS